MKVLITCGATWTPIDEVRVISNISSGEMGHLIADAFIKQKAQVTLLEGPVTHPFSNKKIKIIKYHYFDELAKLLKKELSKKYDIIIHAAAVSDYKIKQTLKGKISSDKNITLHLESTPKLIKDIKRLCPETFLVGFKLEPDFLGISKILKPLFIESSCDLVVVNSLKEGYKGYIIDADERILLKASNKKQIAQGLVNLLI